MAGYIDYELREKGNQSIVRTSTLELYIDAVVRATLHDGIESQMQAFREGFEEVFPLDVLDCFYEEEMDVLLRGVQEPWTAQKLADCVKCNHGYTTQCRQVQWFLEVVAELKGLDQRRFVQFVTGVLLAKSAPWRVCQRHWVQGCNGIHCGPVVGSDPWIDSALWGRHSTICC